MPREPSRGLRLTRTVATASLCPGPGAYQTDGYQTSRAPGELRAGHRAAARAEWHAVRRSIGTCERPEVVLPLAGSHGDESLIENPNKWHGSGGCRALIVAVRVTHPRERCLCHGADRPEGRERQGPESPPPGGHELEEEGEDDGRSSQPHPHCRAQQQEGGEGGSKGTADASKAGEGSSDGKGKPGGGMEWKGREREILHKC